AAVAQLRAAADQLAQTQLQLQEALRRAERAETEAATTRRLVDVLKKAPVGRAGQRPKPA
ncbi:hypothetical protein V2T74_10370, partial [Streptococcus agalactiae]